MYREDVFEPEIDLRDLFWNVLVHWRVILIITILGGLLGGVFSWYRDRTAVTEPSNVQQLLEEEKQLHEATTHAIEYGIAYYEEKLGEERQYIENSAYMQLNPASVASTSIAFRLELNNPEQNSYADLILLGNACEEAVKSEDFLQKEAEKFGMQAELLSELVSSSRIKDATSLTGTIDEQNIEFYESSVYAFKVVIKGRDTTFTMAVAEDLLSYMEAFTEEQLPETAPGMENVRYTFKAGRPISTIGNDLTINTNQYNYRSNIYNDIYRLAQINTSRGTIEKNIPVLGVETVGKPGLSKKYLMVGFVGGFILITLIYVLLYLYGGKLNSAADIQSRFGLRVLGLIPDEKETKKRVTEIDRRIRRRILGYTTGESKEQALEIICANIMTIIDSRSMIILTCSRETETTESIATYLQEIIRGQDTNVQVIYYPCFLQNSEAHAALQKATGTVLIEARGSSRTREIEETTEQIRGLGKSVFGVIVL